MAKQKADHFRFLIFFLIGLIAGCLSFLIVSNNNPVVEDLLEKSNKKETMLPESFAELAQSFLTDLSPYSIFATATPFECYAPENLPNTEMITRIQSNILEHMEIHKACISGDNAFVTSVEKNDEEKAVLLSIRYYSLAEDGTLTSENISDMPFRKKQDRLEVAGWYGDDILYSYIASRERDIKVLTSKVTVGQANPKPMYIEYCDGGIGGGTSERDFGRCVTFNEHDTSQFVSKDLLP